jgi:hypothetical protein
MMAETAQLLNINVMMAETAQLQNINGIMAETAQLQKTLHKEYMPLTHLNPRDVFSRQKVGCILSE